MSFLSKEALLATKKTGFEEVPVYLNGSAEEQIVRVKVLTAREAGEFSARFVGKKNVAAQVQTVATLKSEYVGKCLVDEQGALYFKNKQQAEELAELPAKVIERLFKACTTVNPIGDEADEVEKEVKNSEKTAEEDSSSDSQ